MTAILRVRTVLNGWQGAPGLSTLYFSSPSVGTSAPEAADVAARVRAAWNGSVGLFTTAFTAQVQSQVDVIDDATGSLLGSQPGGAQALVTGTNGANFEAIATMALLQLGTGLILRGRRLKGRLFLGPVATPNVTSLGQLLTATGTTVATAFQGTGSGSTGCIPRVWARPVKPPLTPAPGTSSNVTTWACPPKLSVLRSRRD